MNNFTKYKASLKITLIYLVISGIYVIISDKFILKLFYASLSPDSINTIQSLKGLGFILVTSILLFVLIQGEMSYGRKYLIELERRKGDLTRQTREKEDIYDQLTQRNFFIETILKNLSMGIAVNKINDGSVTFMNNKFSEIYGWPKEELTDLRKFFEKAYPDEEYRNKIFKQVIGDIESGVPEKMHWVGIEIATKEGVKRFVEAWNIPVPEQNLMISTVRDITHQIESEQKIKETQEKYKTIFENSLTAIIVADDSGNYQSVNKAAETMFGYSVKELLRMNAGDLQTPGPETSKEQFEKYIRKGRAIGEFDFISKQGVKRTALYHAIRVWENFNLSVLMDITELKRLQKKLEESNDRLEIITNNLPGAVVRYKINADGSEKFIYASEGTKLVWGVSAEDTIADPSLIWEKVEPGDKQNVKKSIEESAKNLSTWNAEYRSNLKDKSVKWLQGIGSPKKQADGSVIWDSIILDITSRKLAEESLKLNEEIFQLIAENTLDIISLHDADLICQYISPSVKTVRGFDPEELLGTHAFLHIHPQDAPDIERQLIDGRTQAVLKYRILKKDGSYGWFESYSKAALGENQKINNIVTISRDISERVENEKEIENYQMSLQKLTTEITLVEESQRKEIASNIHDNLSQLLVLSKMKLSELLEKSNDNGSKYEIDSIVDHVSEALNNSRKITYDLSPPILYEFGLVKTMNWLVKKIEKEQNVQCIFKTEFDKLNLEESKRILIYRIIQELIVNIIKHARAMKIEILFEKQKGGIRFIVKDDGVGFETTNIYKHEFKTGGFGLFAVKERVKNLKGSFDLRSHMGKGTELRIFIPHKLKSTVAYHPMNQK